MPNETFPARFFARHSSEFFFYDIKQLTPPLPPAPAIRKFVIEIERIHKHHVQAAAPVFRRSVVMLAAAIYLRARFYVGDQSILTSDGIRQLGVRFSDAVQPVRIASAKAGLSEFLRQPFRFCVRLRALTRIENFNKIALREKLGNPLLILFLPFIRADHAHKFFAVRMRRS